MRYFLSPHCALKQLEQPSVYDMRSDELYELDGTGFAFLRRCAGEEGCSSEGCDREFLGYTLKEGIVTDRRVSARRPPLKKSPEPSLRYLEFQLTTRCSLSCRHCYVGSPDDAELPLEKIERVLFEFEQMQGLRLLITGGEPLLHASFTEVNELLSGYAFRKVLFTNGMLLTEEVAASLQVDEIQVSVDGLERGHEALRGKGTFSRAMDAIDASQGAGLDVSVSTMVHSRNLDEFDRMEKLFRRLGIKEWSVDVPCAVGNLRENTSFRVEPEVAGRYLGYGFGEGLHGGGKGFACGLHLASVLADGTVAKCAFYRSAPAGSVDEGLGISWSRITPVPLDELECDCAVRDACRGGCRYRAELLGNPLGRDLYRCFAYGQEGIRGPGSAKRMGCR
jgi:radical SAM protein with 4Fe4S-binding SPASM domain